MTRKPLTQRVDVSFVGIPPARQVERASGVSDVEVDGHVLRCLVSGSFQPFLEALRGHEVVSLSAEPVDLTRPDGLPHPSHESDAGRTPTADLARKSE